MDAVKAGQRIGSGITVAFAIMATVVLVECGVPKVLFDHFWTYVILDAICGFGIAIAAKSWLPSRGGHLALTAVLSLVGQALMVGLRASVLFAPQLFHGHTLLSVIAVVLVGPALLATVRVWVKPFLA